MQSFLFYMVLVHETIDFCTMGITVCTTTLSLKKKKNSCRKVRKGLDDGLNLPLNEFKLGLLFELNYIVCKLIYI